MRLALTAGVAATLLVAAVACSGEMPMSEAENGAASPAAARAEIEEYERVPDFVAPGAAFDAAGKLRGKRIFEIPITSEVPFIDAVEEGMRQAADAVGAELVVYPNQGEPSQWAQGIRAAIAQKADAVTLFAQNPAVLGPQIAQAQEAGIPVIVLRTTGEGSRASPIRAARSTGRRASPARSSRPGGSRPTG